MNRLGRSLLLATGALLVVGGGVWAVPKLLATGSDGGVQALPSDAGNGDVAAPRPEEAGGPGAADAPRDLATGGDPASAPRAGGVVPTSLRTPEGIDLSDPKVVRGLLRDALAQEAPPWDRIAHLLGVLSGPVDEDVRARLAKELVH